MSEAMKKEEVINKFNVDCLPELLCKEISLDPRIVEIG